MFHVKVSTVLPAFHRPVGDSDQSGCNWCTAFAVAVTDFVDDAVEFSSAFELS